MQLIFFKLCCCLLCTVTKCHNQLFWSLVNLSGLLNAVTKVVTGFLKTTKDAIFVVQ